MVRFGVPSLSPVTLVLQYYSFLLKGLAPRLLLLAGRKYATFNDWAAAEPRHLAALRRGASVGASWVHDRFKKLQRLPWTLAIITDPRQTAAKVEETIMAFERAPSPLPQSSLTNTSVRA